MSNFTTALSRMRRSPYQTLMVVLALAFSFFLLSSFATFSFISQRVLNFFERKPQVIAYLKDETTTAQAQELVEELNQTGKVQEVEYVSKQEALEFYREKNKDNPLLLEMVTADILPASVEVSATQIDYLEDVVDILKKEEIVAVSESGQKEIDFQASVVDALRQWTQVIRRLGLVIGGLLVLEVFLLLVVITSMKIALRSEEVEIMHLLGATHWFVRLPFLWEGALYGFFGAGVGFALMYGVLLQIQPLLVEFLAGMNVLPISQQFLLMLWGGLTAFATLLCGLGSFVATKRYLKQ